MMLYIHGIIRLVRLSPFLPPEKHCASLKTTSNRGGKPGRQIAFEERGDAKLHHLSPRRQMSLPQGRAAKGGRRELRAQRRG
jgi:hypothetical protein